MKESGENMDKIKKILLGAGVIVFIAVFAIWMFSSDLEHIEDTNGADNYTLQQITDDNIINMDIGALNVGRKKSAISDTVTYSTKKFTGVAEIFTENIATNRFTITVNHAAVNSGNFKMVLVYNDDIVHEFKLNELTQEFTLENVNGTVSLRIAGESADFMFDYHVI